MHLNQKYKRNNDAELLERSEVIILGLKLIV